MEKIEFSQDELTYLLGILDRSIQQGGLRLGDALVLVPIASKLKAKVKTPPPQPEEKSLTVADAKNAAPIDKKLN